LKKIHERRKNGERKTQERQERKMTRKKNEDEEQKMMKVKVFGTKIKRSCLLKATQLEILCKELLEKILKKKVET